MITVVRQTSRSWPSLSLLRAPPIVAITPCRCRHRIVTPGKLSPTRTIPPTIVKPPYVSDPHFNLGATRNSTQLKSRDEISRMRDACRVARHVLGAAERAVRPGVSTEEIDVIVHEECVKNNAYPSPLLYRGYPKSVCTSVNNVACHGIPDDVRLEGGDIINIDVTVYYNGYHGDLSETYLVGDVDDDAVRLVQAACNSRDAAIAKCGPGVPFTTIGATISELANKLGFNVVAEFCGHGIGQNFHEPPDIIHVENIMEGTMQPGMTFTIEPILSEGDPRFRILDDGWTAVSVDGSRSAQFEHTLLITDSGVEILTERGH